MSDHGCFRMTKIAIVGSGLIGRAWATVFASHGCSVALHDVAPGAAESARAHIGTNLEELAGHGLVEDPKGSLARIRAMIEAGADPKLGSGYIALQAEGHNVWFRNIEIKTLPIPKTP